MLFNFIYINIYICKFKETVAQQKLYILFKGRLCKYNWRFFASCCPFRIIYIQSYKICFETKINSSHATLNNLLWGIFEYKVETSKNEIDIIIFVYIIITLYYWLIVQSYLNLFEKSFYLHGNFTEATFQTMVRYYCTCANENF